MRQAIDRLAEMVVVDAVLFEERMTGRLEETAVESGDAELGMAGIDKAEQLGQILPGGAPLGCR